MDYIAALSILKEGYTLLRSIEPTCWLSAGTALGAHRDNLNRAFVEKDTDIDVGIVGKDGSDEQYKQITSLFTAHNFIVFRTYKGNGKRTQIALCKNGIIFDIYLFYKKDNELYSYTEHGVMSKPISFITNMSTVSIDKEKYFVPTPIDEYLALRYGKDWDIPTKEKHPWEKECANLRIKKVKITDVGGIC